MSHEFPTPTSGTNLAHLGCKILQNTDKRCHALLTPKSLIQKEKIRQFQKNQSLEKPVFCAVALQRPDGEGFADQGGFAGHGIKPEVIDGSILAQRRRLAPATIEPACWNTWSSKACSTLASTQSAIAARRYPPTVQSQRVAERDQRIARPARGRAGNPGSP